MEGISSHYLSHSRTGSTNPRGLRSTSHQTMCGTIGGRSHQRTSQSSQRKGQNKKGIGVLVTTPGRLLDHLQTTVALQTSTYPIANRRIQIAMKWLLEEVLNHRDSQFSHLAKNLASVSFAASWTDDFDATNPLPASDCIITLNYNCVRSAIFE